MVVSLSVIAGVLTSAVGPGSVRCTRPASLCLVGLVGAALPLGLVPRRVPRRQFPARVEFGVALGLHLGLQRLVRFLVHGLALVGVVSRVNIAVHPQCSLLGAAVPSLHLVALPFNGV